MIALVSYDPLTSSISIVVDADTPSEQALLDFFRDAQACPVLKPRTPGKVTSLLITFPLLRNKVSNRRRKRNGKS